MTSAVLHESHIARLPDKVLWRPHPGPQTLSLTCPLFELLVGGAKGGGKSDTFPSKALAHIKMYGAEAKVLVLRQTFKELRDIMRKFYARCRLAGGKYVASDKMWVFPNGGIIEFGHTADGVDPYWGREFTLVMIDELTRAIESEEDYILLLAGLRSTHPGLKLQAFLASNPGGVGHGWVRERFLRTPYGQGVLGPTGLPRIFIPSRLKDNPSLANSTYERQIMSLGERDRAAYYDGDWDAYDGSVFTLTPGVQTITWDQFEREFGCKGIPAHWNIYRCMDWGYARPFAVIWVAVSPERKAIAFREWYGVDKDDRGQTRPNVGLFLPPSQVAAGIRAVESEAQWKVKQGWAGKDLFDAGDGSTSAGVARVEHFLAEGIHFDPWASGKGSRKAKLSALTEWLHSDVPTDGSAQLGSDLRLIVDPYDAHSCHHTVRTLGLLQFDMAKGGEDVETDGEDHLYDALSAFCLMRPWAGQVLARPSDLHESLQINKAYETEAIITPWGRGRK